MKETKIKRFEFDLGNQSDARKYEVFINAAKYRDVLEEFEDYLREDERNAKHIKKLIELKGDAQILTCSFWVDVLFKEK